MRTRRIALCCALLLGGGGWAEETAWFDGGVAVGTGVSGGGWEPLPKDGVERTVGRYVLDEPATAFVFAAEKAEKAGVYTNLILKTKAKFDSAYEDCYPEIPEGKEIGMAVCSFGGETFFYVLAKDPAAETNRWTNTQIAATVDTDVSVVATVTKVGSEAKVEYAFDGKVSGPHAVASDGAIQHASYVGSGEIAELTGWLVIGVEIEVDGVDIHVNDTDARRFETAKPEGCVTVEEFLAADAKATFGDAKFKTPNMKVAVAYALGLVKFEGDAIVPVNNGEITIEADACADVAEGIPLRLLGGVTPRTDTGTTVAYQLQGSANGEDWAEIGDAVSEIPAIPLGSVGGESGRYRYFKVVTKLSGGAK